ncbi:molybdenum cofactor biosynthesis protein, partial [Staphylococcus epidermidis]
MGEHQNVKLNRTVKAAVLTVSDTRNFDTDKGGQCVLQLLQVDNVEV